MAGEPKRENPLVAFGLWPIVVAIAGVLLWSRRDDATNTQVPIDATPTPAPEPGPTARAIPGALAATESLLVVPRGRVRADQCLRAPPVWNLPGYDHEHLVRWLRDANTPDALRTAWSSRASCDASGCTLPVTLAELEAIPRGAREHLYPTLGELPQNTYYLFPFERRASASQWISDPHLPPLARDLLERLSYRHGPWTSFADLPVLCERLATDDERIAALEVLRSRTTLRVKVRVPAGEAAADVARWWEAGTSFASVLTRLEASGEAGVDVAELLPSAMRARFAQYPQEGERPYDCFWTAEHFWGGDGRISTPATFAQVLRDEYREVGEADARFGDAVVLWSSEGLPAHAANLLAERYLFTKNGNSALRPWLILRLEDLQAQYPRATGPRYYRLLRSH